MREIVFALEFRGKAGPVAGSAATRHARTTATGQVFRTVLETDTIESRIEHLGGDLAILESRVEPVERFGDGTFVEDGTITYGRVGSVTFTTIGRGWVGQSPIADRVHGGSCGR